MLFIRLRSKLTDNSITRHEGLAYDAERSAILLGYGIEIIRFTNKEVINNFDAVCQQINHAFDLS